MAVKLRLMRMGKKKQPTYRIVAADTRSPRDGRFIEIVGTYAPREEPSQVAIDNKKAVAWLTNGARPSDTVRKLLEISGAWGEYRALVPEPAAKPARKRKTSAKAEKKNAKKAAAKKASAKKQPAKKEAAKKVAAEAPATEAATAGEAPAVAEDAAAPEEPVLTEESVAPEEAASEVSEAPETDGQEG